MQISIDIQTDTHTNTPNSWWRNTATTNKHLTHSCTTLKIAATQSRQRSSLLKRRRKQQRKHVTLFCYVVAFIVGENCWCRCCALFNRTHDILLWAMVSKQNATTTTTTNAKCYYLNVNTITLPPSPTNHNNNSKRNCDDHTEMLLTWKQNKVCTKRKEQTYICGAIYVYKHI